MGSEMCIRDRYYCKRCTFGAWLPVFPFETRMPTAIRTHPHSGSPGKQVASDSDARSLAENISKKTGELVAAAANSKIFATPTTELRLAIEKHPNEQSRLRGVPTNREWIGDAKRVYRYRSSKSAGPGELT